MGILETLRNVGRPWLGRALSKLTGADSDLERPRLKTNYPQAHFRMLPYVDQSMAETPESRRLYRTMLKDAVVRPAFYSKVLSVATLDLSVTPDDPSNRIDREAAEFAKYAIQRMNGGLAGLAEELLPPMLIDGYALAEKVFAPLRKGRYAGNWTIDRLRSKHPDLYDLSVDEQGQATEILGKGVATGERHNPKRFVLGRYLPLYGNPLGTSDLAAAYQAYWRRDTAWKLRHTHLKNLNGPFLLATYGRNDLLPTISEMLDAAKAGGYAAVPEGVKLEVHDIASRNSVDFGQSIKDLNQEIMLCLTGAFLQALEGNQTGARSIGEVHQSSADLLVWHLANVLSRIINTEVVPDLCDLNFAGFSDYPSMSLGGIDDASLKDSAAIDQALVTIGVPLSKKEIYARYNRSPPVDDADTFKPATPAMPPGGAAGSAVPFPSLAAKFADDVAAPGKAGQQAEKLLKVSQDAGIELLAEICAAAFARWPKVGIPHSLFTDDERQQLVDSLAATTATAHLLGQKRLRDQLAKRAVKHAETFADIEPIKPLPPVQALDYFRNLVPGIGGNPLVFGPAMQRQAFTLAVTTEQTLLTAVQDAIAQSLATGVGGTYDVQSLLDAAGVSAKNPQYAEMVYRTNMMDSYQQGYEKERTDPDVVEMFPVWRYDTVGDGRVGEDHAPMDGKYYPASAPFATVRGKRIYNCRCVPTAIYIDDWKVLQRKGARAETQW